MDLGLRKQRNNVQNNIQEPSYLSEDTARILVTKMGKRIWLENPKEREDLMDLDIEWILIFK